MKRKHIVRKPRLRPRTHTQGHTQDVTRVTPRTGTPPCSLHRNLHSTNLLFSNFKPFCHLAILGHKPLISTRWFISTKIMIQHVIFTFDNFSGRSDSLDNACIKNIITTAMDRSFHSANSHHSYCTFHLIYSFSCQILGTVHRNCSHPPKSISLIIVVVTHPKRYFPFYFL